MGATTGRNESVQAENLFLRRQLALYIERGVPPRRVDAATRVSLALLARLFDWRSSLVVVKPATMIRWQRAGWRLFWRPRSRPGRPPIPEELRALIRRMANQNHLWGEERIANELLVKLGIRVSPRTVRKYLPKRPHGPHADQHWSTFLKNHATAIVACDFFSTVTAALRKLYVFLITEHGTRRLARMNLEDSIKGLSLDGMGSPMPSLKANALCQPVIGTIRRECLDRMIPISKARARSIWKERKTHYNRGPPHHGCVRTYRTREGNLQASRNLTAEIDWRPMCSCSPNRS